MTLSIENAISAPSSVTGNVDYFELPGGSFPNPVITNPNPASIQVDQPWQVRFNFTASGPFFQFFGDDVRWDCDLLMEQYGPGENPAVLPSISLPGVNSPSHTFTGVINISASTVPSGVYRLVARVAMRPIGSNIILATGFVELGLVQFYQG